jgi:hypothetical protein
VVMRIARQPVCGVYNSGALMEPFRGFVFGLTGGTGTLGGVANGSPFGAHRLQRQAGARSPRPPPFQLLGRGSPQRATLRLFPLGMACVGATARLGGAGS